MGKQLLMISGVFLIFILNLFIGERLFVDDYIDYNDWEKISPNSGTSLINKYKISFVETADLYKDTYIIDVKIGDILYTSKLLVEDDKLVEKEILYSDYDIENLSEYLNKTSVVKEDFKTKEKTYYKTEM